MIFYPNVKFNKGPQHRSAEPSSLFRIRTFFIFQRYFVMPFPILALIFTSCIRLEPSVLDTSKNPAALIASFLLASVGAGGGTASGTSAGTSSGTSTGTSGISYTGQTQCFYAVGTTWTLDTNCTQTYTVGNFNFPYGQDSHYLRKPYSRSFTGPTQVGASDYITTDNITSLVWKTCSEGLSGSNCKTGTASTYTWTAAASACTPLNSGAGYAGKTDWRLPTIKELRTLPNYGSNPAFDASYFPGTVSNNYWSSTVRAALTTNAYYMVASSGGDFFGLKTAGTYNVRCVSGTASNTQTLTDNGDGTVTESPTGLLWQKCLAGQNALDCSGTANSIYWSDAITYCENLSFAGKTNWRLPDVNELKNLIVDSQVGPYINLTYFPNLGNSDCWSSTSAFSGPGSAWTVDFSQGFARTRGKTFVVTFGLRCVSGP
jgi:hypothetical protein